MSDPVRDPCSTPRSVLPFDPELAANPPEIESPVMEWVNLVDDAAEAGEAGIGFAVKVAPYLGEVAAVGIASTALSGIGLVMNAIEISHDLITAKAQGTTFGLLRAAFGGASGSPESRAWAAGIGAVLLDLPAADRAALRAQFTTGHGPARELSSRFDDAVQAAQRGRTDSPSGFADAREIYLDAIRSYGDGVAAAVEDWSMIQPERDEVFHRARARTSDLMRDLSTAMSMRTEAQASKYAGFQAFMRGEVSTSRSRLDPFYRSGVDYARHVAHSQGREALQLEWQRIEQESGMLLRPAQQCPVQG